MVTESVTEEEVIETYVGKLNGNVWGVSFAIILALILFAATNLLVLKGGPTVGQHLEVLSHYFPGYSVTFVGSFIGAGWALLTGYILARLVCAIYNFASK